MRSRVFSALQHHPALARPNRSKHHNAPPVATIPEPVPALPARRLPPRPPRFKTPRLLKMSSRGWKSAPKTPETRVPYLRLSGRWLEEHGFSIGAVVLVTVEKDRVILTNAAAVMPGVSKVHP